MPFVNVYPEIKVAESDIHVFFLNGPFSQWWYSLFTARVPVEGEPDLILDFHCCEQYMMARKAALMGDLVMLKEIMEVEQGADWRDAPREIKKLGRKIKPWDQKLWDDNCDAIVLEGNLAKFRQNAHLRDFLFAFRGKHFVEGADYDKVWGVGLKWNDPAITNPANWLGTNKLGYALDLTLYELSHDAIRTTIQNASAMR